MLKSANWHIDTIRIAQEATVGVAKSALKNGYEAGGLAFPSLADLRVGRMSSES